MSMTLSRSVHESHLLGASNELLSGLRRDLRGLLCHLRAHSTN